MSEPRERALHTPSGWSTVTPRMMAEDPEQLVEFITRVFDAVGDYRADSPAVLRIGDSIVMVSDASAREPATAFLYVHVPDADATYRRAIEAGARSLEVPSDMPYGDRRGMVQDGWGNIWQIATYRAGAER
jgi:PhnB protein